MKDEEVKVDYSITDQSLEGEIQTPPSLSGRKRKTAWYSDSFSDESSSSPIVTVKKMKPTPTRYFISLIFFAKLILKALHLF